MAPDEGHSASPPGRASQGGHRRPLRGRFPLRLRLHPRSHRRTHRTTRPWLRRLLPERHLDRGPTTPCASRPPRGLDHRRRLDQGRDRLPTLGHGRLRGREVTGQPLFALANVIDDRDMGIPTSSGARTCSPPPPPAAAVGCSRRGRRGEAGWGERTQLPVFAHLPMLVDERGRSSPSARTPSPSRLPRQGLPPRSLRNYLALLGWSRRATPRSSRSRPSSSSSA